MLKMVRRNVLIIMLLVLAQMLVACGSETSNDITPYSGARELTVDQASLDSVKSALKGIKEIKVETYAFKDDPATVKTYYEAQYKEKGWADRQDKIAEVARQQTSGGWALTYEKNNKVVSLVVTPGSAASARFPNAQGDNVLAIISGIR
jgi:hypothetical protein